MKTTPKLLILVGPPGAGKSTFAKYHLRTEENWFRVCRDDLRLMQFSNANLEEGDEAKLSAIVDSIILSLLEKNTNVLVDATHTYKKYLDHYQTKFGHIAEISFKVFDVNKAELKQRVDDRYEATGKHIPSKVLDEQIERFERVKSTYDFSTKKAQQRTSNLIEQDPNLPNGIICDLDGTLAIIGHRNPFDSSRCEQDQLNLPVAHILRLCKSYGDKIILFSGRTDNFMPQTKRWLAAHNIDYDILAMRKTGDMRKDAIVKLEMVEEHITEKYNIRFTLDDRNQVVDMWRKEAGFTCFQVNYGDF